MYRTKVKPLFQAFIRNNYFKTISIFYKNKAENNKKNDVVALSAHR